MEKILLVFLLIIHLACNKKAETTTPVVQNLNEAVYASGMIKSKNQYQSFPKINGIIDKIYVKEGDFVKKGQIIYSINNQTQRLNQENAFLNVKFLDIKENQGKLKDAKQMVDLAFIKMRNDSVLFQRQKNLWKENIGTQIELEQKEILYENSKAAYFSALIKYDDLKRQLEFSSQQAEKNFLISKTMTDDYSVKSEIDGVVYLINYNEGEFVNIQNPVAVIGSDKDFVLEMQIDEYDIMRISIGQKVLVTMDSYKGKVFEAKITKINPIMNQRSKTFLVESEFVRKPEKLYPNLTFEANIVIQSKDNALLIPRSYLVNDSTIILSNGEKKTIKTGLKDYKFVEVLSGLSKDNILIKPQ